MRGHSRAVAAGVLAVLAASAVAGCGATPGTQNTTAAGGSGHHRYLHVSHPPS